MLDKKCCFIRFLIVKKGKNIIKKNQILDKKENAT